MHSMFYCFLLEVLIINLNQRAVEILASRFLDEPIISIDIGSDCSAPVLERIDVFITKPDYIRNQLLLPCQVTQVGDSCLLSVRIVTSLTCTQSSV